MSQLIITIIIIAAAATYAGHKTYMAFRGKSSPCSECNGCSLKDRSPHKYGKCQKKECQEKK